MFQLWYSLGKSIQTENYLDNNGINYFTDSIAYEKMCSALRNKRLKKGIMKASPIKQTSCLEGFHSVLNQFSPKMIGYSYRGMFCRYVFDITLIPKTLKKNAFFKNIYLMDL